MHDSSLWNEVFLIRIKAGMTAERAADDAWAAVRFREQARGVGYSAREFDRRVASAVADGSSGEAQGEAPIDHYINELRKMGRSFVELNDQRTNDSARVIFTGFVAPNMNLDELTKLMREHFDAHTRGFAAST